MATVEAALSAEVSVSTSTVAQMWRQRHWPIRGDGLGVAEGAERSRRVDSRDGPAPNLFRRPGRSRVAAS